MRKRRNTGKDNKATGCTGLTGKQKHCSRQTVSTVAGLAVGAHCYLVLVLQAAFQMSLAPIPPLHFMESLP